MNYVTNMDEVYALTDKRYRAFLELVISGIEVHAALHCVEAKRLGISTNVTDLEARDARVLLSQL